LDEKVAAAVFGNVGTIIAFRVGAADAEVLEKEFTPTFTAGDLVNLTKYDMYLKLMINGVASAPFSASGLPPVVGATGNKEKVIRVSRERYAKPREIIEEKIIRWSGMQIAGVPEKTDEELEEEVKKALAEKKREQGVSKALPKAETSVVEEIEEKVLKAREALFEKPKVHGVDFLKHLEKAKSEVTTPAIVIKPAQKEEKGELEIEPRPGVKSVPEALSNSTSDLFLEAKEKDEKKKKTREEIFPYEIKCSVCGKPDRVSFKPDPTRPVYCKECLKIEKEKERQAKKNKK